MKTHDISALLLFFTKTQEFFKTQFENPETQFLRNFYVVNIVASVPKSLESTEKV